MGWNQILKQNNSSEEQSSNNTTATNISNTIWAEQNASVTILFNYALENVIGDTSANGQCWLHQLTRQVDKYYKKQKSSEQSHPTVITSITTHLFLPSGVYIFSKKIEPPPNSRCQKVTWH